MSTNSRRVKRTNHWPLICAIAGLLLGTHAVALDEFAVAQERKKIVVAYVAASEQMIIPALAQQTGISHKHGLDAQVVLVSGSPRNVQSLIAGNFDFTMAGATPLVRSRSDGAPGDPGGDRELLDATNYRRAAGENTQARRPARKDRRRDPVWFRGRHLPAHRAQKRRPTARSGRDDISDRWGGEHGAGVGGGKIHAGRRVAATPFRPSEWAR